jgi:hypothetical protein
VAVAILAAVLIPLNIAASWRRGTPVERDVVVVIYAALVVVSALVILLVFQREELVVADGLMTRRNLLGVPKRYELDAIGGMARRDVLFVLARQPARYVVVYDKQHRCLFKMNRVIWDPADVGKLHSIVGGDGKTQVVTSAELEDEFPGSVAWLLTHPLVLIAVEFAVLMGVLIALVSLTDALRPKA